MMERLTGHLGYLTQYAESFIDSLKVQNVCIHIYTGAHTVKYTEICRLCVMSTATFFSFARAHGMSLPTKREVKDVGIAKPTASIARLTLAHIGWTSFRIFLRVMWEPFESEFDSINLRFDDRVRIVIRTAGVVEHTRLRSKELLKAQQKNGKTRKSPLGKTF